MVTFGKLVSYEVDGRFVHLDYEQHPARLEIISPEIINVFCGLERDSHDSKAIDGVKVRPSAFTVESMADGGLCIRTEQVQVRVADDFKVDFYDLADAPVCLDYRGSRRPLERVSEEVLEMLKKEGHMFDEGGRAHDIEVVKAMEGSASFYGLGDKTGFLNKRGYDYIMWNTDDPAPQVDSFRSLYKSIPFFMTLTDTHVYGLFFDNTYKTWFDMGKESNDYFWFGADKGNLDYYYIAGQTMAQVLSNYTWLTGTCPLPQKWTLGYHQSRWGYTTWEDVASVAENMRRYEIPCDVLHFDIDYMQDYKVFTWNQQRYHGCPEKLLGELSDHGFKAVTIIDPGVKKEAGYAVYEEGMANDYFAHAATGEVYENAVWPGISTYPDFGRAQVRRWWGEKHESLLKLGVRGIWNDMNEPASFNGPLPDDVVFHDEGNMALHEKMHNVYGHLMSRATYEGLERLDGRRPFVITRACYAGSQKFTTVWTGDNHSIWGHLQMAVPQLCNLGLSGFPFAGTDVGGFSSDVTPELLVRWVQVGCFSPLFRNHSANGTRRQEPWLFGPEVLHIYRKYVQLRYHLIPYMYDLFFEEEQTGAPVMRPLVYDYEGDKNVRDINDEFMVGPDILVAPVLTQGTVMRSVYLPEGTWFDYWTREKHVGPTWIMREAPLDTCPIYVRAGAILPVMPPQNYVGEKPEDTLMLEVWPGEGCHDHYLDNGEDFMYRQGAYDHYRFLQNAEGEVTVELIHEGYQKPYEHIYAKCGEETLQIL